MKKQIRDKKEIGIQRRVSFGKAFVCREVGEDI